MSLIHPHQHPSSPLPGYNLGSWFNISYWNACLNRICSYTKSGSRGRPKHTLLTLPLEIRYNIYTLLLTSPHTVIIALSIPVSGPVLTLSQTCQQLQAEIAAFASRHTKLNLATFQGFGYINLDTVSVKVRAPWMKTEGQSVEVNGDKRLAEKWLAWKAFLEEVERLKLENPELVFPKIGPWRRRLFGLWDRWEFLMSFGL
jgi:hypothetical protein